MRLLYDKLFRILWPHSLNNFLNSAYELLRRTLVFKNYLDGIFSVVSEYNGNETAQLHGFTRLFHD